MCLQRFICSLVSNAALAPRPVNRPAFPFSGGASRAEDGTHEPVPEILGDGGLVATRTHAQQEGRAERGACWAAVEEKGVI